MDRLLFFEKDISDGGGSMMLTVPRESHGHHLHRGHHIGGHRDPGNHLEQQYEKNLSTQPASDHLPLPRGVSSSKGEGSSQAMSPPPLASPPL